MKVIELTKGKVTVVDDEDFEHLAQYRWCCMAGGYAGRGGKAVSGQKRGKNILMHRVIMNAPDGLEVDHKNGDTLDNRRSNLRLCTHVDNTKNLGKRSNNTSGVTGVCLYRGKYLAQIRINGVSTKLGSFDTMTEAVAARKAAEVQHFGEFRRITNSSLC